MVRVPVVQPQQEHEDRHSFTVLAMHADNSCSPASSCMPASGCRLRCFWQAPSQRFRSGLLLLHDAALGAASRALNEVWVG